MHLSKVTQEVSGKVGLNLLMPGDFATCTSVVGGKE
jgi:hypothetical protein